jgi:glyoxylate/hydroxypyruvate reductase A
MRILCAWGRGDAEVLRAPLASRFPQAHIHVWPDAPATVDYAIVWRPPANVFEHTRVTGALFNYGAGVDGLVDLPTLPSGIPVFRLEDAGMAEQMAEYVLAAVLRAWRGFDVYALRQREARWRREPQRAREDFRIGILGMGVLGRAVADTLRGHGFAVAGWSRTPRAHAGVTLFSGNDALPAFLARTEVLVCLLPLTPATQGLVDRKFLAGLPQGAHLINVARGAIIVDADLVAALDAGQLASATLDVFREEPLPASHPFWHHPRISITPHVSAVTLAEPSVAQIAARIERLENGAAVGGAVDVSRGY